MYGRDKHVQSEIELVAVDEVRLGHVALNHHGALLRDLRPFRYYFDACAAGGGRLEKEKILIKNSVNEIYTNSP